MLFIFGYLGEITSYIYRAKVMSECADRVGTKKIYTPAQIARKSFFLSVAKKKLRLKWSSNCRQNFKDDSRSKSAVEENII